MPSFNFFNHMGYAGTVTATFASPSRPATLEKTVRPFIALDQRLPDPPRVAPTVEIVDHPEAFLEWGKASSFFTDAPHIDPVEDMNADGYLTALGDNYSPSVAGDKKKPKERPPQDKKPGIRAYDEIDRKVRRIKVYDPEPDDPADPAWVIVEQIESIRFRGPEGNIIKMNLKPPPPPVKPAVPPT